MQDFYAVLGVSLTASAAEIKAAYQRLILEVHPDKGLVQDTEAFNAVQQAYAILRDEQTRKLYDAQYKAAALMQDGPLNMEVDLDEMSFNETTECYIYPCRCSGQYEISQADMELSVNVVGCSLCSLRIRVLYATEEIHID